MATSCLSTTSPPPTSSRSNSNNLLIHRDFPQTTAQSSYSASSIGSYQPLKKIKINKIPRQGPHCEHFLKYIGVIKTEDVDENFEHFCNESNDYCARWQNYLTQLQLILCNDPICIEVFIGPENNAILMEQWIIKIIEKTSGTNLPLSSLCSAIRSQLHFSQISSWTDLLKTSDLKNNDFFDNPRIRKSKKFGKPKLDILYRIKTFDSTSCFNEKPLVHEFPDAAITEKYSISVCLKSSPRCKSIPNFLQHGSIDNSTNALYDLDTNRGCNEKGKHNCNASYETKELITNLQLTTPSSSTTHREKQLLKYKKRLLKYEKKTNCNDDNNYRKHETETKSSDINFSINSIRPPLYTTLQSQTNSIPFYNNLSDTKSTQTANLEMITTGTQTEMEEYCEHHHHHHHYVCLNSDLFHENATMDKSDLLLQSIERTGVVNSISCHRRLKTKLSDNNLTIIKKLPPKINCNDFKLNLCDNLTNLDQVDCRLCKRQKTKHNFLNNSPNSNFQTQNWLFSQRQDSNEISNNECEINVLPSETNTCQCLKDEHSKHKVRPNNFNNNNTITDLNKLKICSPLNDRMFIEESQFQTPTNSINKTSWEMGNSTKLSFDRTIKNKLIGKNIPKVNLTQMFNENPDFDCKNDLSPKSFPYSPTSPLSTKNLISAAILKRRSRHLSEISSERSSIGSEEHISDDEFCNFSPVFLSPNKTSKSYFAKEILPFGKRALLGSLEESLLQKCFTPKFTVDGFKVLLGASGQFCPTQLTIPVITSLYELKSQTLTTPYMVRFLNCNL